jgi:hypothetical protein
MRLEYNILWLDNDLKDYINNGDVNSINEFLFDLGFEPNIVTVFDEADLDKHLNINYDLIISDFNLNKENGDVIIYRLREEKKLDTEILFYSAKTNFLDDTDVKERLAFMERINIQIGRHTLLDKIEKVIELTVKRLLEINATRGLITSATSELDVVIEGIILHLVYNHLKLNDGEIDEIINFYVEDFLKKSPDFFLRKYKEVGFQNWFPRIEASRKWNIFRDLLKKIDNEEVKSFLTQNKTYCKEVIDIRNKFAHAKSELVDGKLVLKGQYGQENFEFDNEACIRIRHNLINHKKQIEALKNILGIL